MAWTVGSVYVLCIDKEFYYVLGVGGTFLVELLRHNIVHFVLKAWNLAHLCIFFMLNHLRKGHNLIGHSFGRNLHKSNMAAAVSHEKCLCGPFVYGNI